jgi:hypothetical protein
MTDLLHDALEALQRLPPERQDYITRAILALADDGEPEEIDPRDLSAVFDGLAQIERGELHRTRKYRPCFAALRNEGSIFSARGF